VFINIPAAHEFDTFDSLDFRGLSDHDFFGWVIFVSGGKKTIACISEIS
jgi:hypothetical protein